MSEDAVQSAMSQVGMLFGGLPYKGPAYDRKEGDPETKQPLLVSTAHVKIFDMSKPEDVQEYTDVWTKIVKGEYVMGVEERNYVPATQNYIIFLRWLEQYYTHPALRPKEL